ncbi:DUF3396 domain-containing protein, partial [Archangium sp.]|uniref:DUF3396 domain-containing protein n=1 Tax=Archangium sp. TaxID=1872627 RepID=UPI002ED8DE38
LAWFADDNGDWQELDASGWNVIRRQLLDAEWPGSHVFDLCEHPDAASGYEVEYCGKGLGAFRPDVACAVCFWLPTEYLEEHGPRRVRELALELAAPLPFNSGHAGLAFNRLGTPLELHPLCLRYPGMDVLDLMQVSETIGTRVRGAYWLTFLGQPVLGELGGTTGLRARLSSPDITVQELDGARAVVTLGNWPEAGDTQQGRDLPVHRELARVLEPWLHLRRIPWSGFSDEDMRRWERRFLD